MSQILVCDYCKKEKDKDDLTKVIFKKRQKELTKYDVCSDCHTLLTEQFQAKFESRDETMTLPAPPISVKEKEKKTLVQSIEDRDIADPSKLNEDIEPEPDVEQVRVIANGPETIKPVGPDNKCPHLNKGRILGVKKGEQPYQVCRDCKKHIPIKKKEEQ